MRTNDRVKADEEWKKPRRVLLIGIAAAAVVVVAIGALILFQVIDDAPVTADQPVTEAPPNVMAEVIATRFVEAFGAFDVEQAIIFLADDADIDIGGTAGDPVEGFRRFNSWFQAMGYQQLLDSCEETGTSVSGTYLRCAFDYHLLGSDEIGLGPYRGSFFSITVRDGAIVRAGMELNYIDEFSSQRWEPFAIWVSTTYPEDAAVMYTDDTFNDGRLTEESIQLWERHSQEYVAAEIAEIP